MKTTIDFFFVPKQYLEPNPDSDIQRFLDQIVSHGFSKAILAIADKYNTDYLTARRCLIQIQQSQSTFSLYGICSHVFEGKGWAASQFIVLLAQNTNVGETKC